MKIDVSKAVAGIEGLLPWDLTLTVDGVDYPTRRPTIGDVMALEKLAAGNVKAGPMAEVIRQTVFAEPRPAVDAWSAEAAGGCLIAFLMYFGQHSQGNSKAIASGLRPAMAAAAVEAGVGSSS